MAIMPFKSIPGCTAHLRYDKKLPSMMSQGEFDTLQLNRTCPECSLSINYVLLRDLKIDRVCECGYEFWKKYSRYDLVKGIT